MSSSSSPASAQVVAALQAQCDASPYIRFAGIRVVAIDAVTQSVHFSMAFRPEFEGGDGTGEPWRDPGRHGACRDGMATCGQGLQLRLQARRHRGSPDLVQARP